MGAELIIDPNTATQKIIMTTKLSATQKNLQKEYFTHSSTLEGWSLSTPLQQRPKLLMSIKKFILELPPDPDYFIAASVVCHQCEEDNVFTDYTSIKDSIKSRQDFLDYFFFKGTKDTEQTIFQMQLFNQLLNTRFIKSIQEFRTLINWLKRSLPGLNLLSRRVVSMALFQSKCFKNLEKIHMFLLRDITANKTMESNSVSNLIVDICSLQQEEYPFLQSKSTRNLKEDKKQPKNPSSKLNSNKDTSAYYVTSSVNANPLLPIVTINIGGIPTTTLLDTGAVACLINSNFVMKNRLKFSLSKYQKQITIQDINQGSRTFPNRVTCQRIHTYSPHTFHLVDDLPYDAIIGYNFISLHPEIWNLVNNTKANLNSNSDIVKVNKVTITTSTAPIPENDEIIQVTKPKLNLKEYIENLKIPDPFKKLLHDYEELFTPVTSIPPHRNSDYKINIDEKSWENLKNRPLPKYSVNQLDFLKSEVTRLLECGLIERCYDSIYSVPSIVPKPHSNNMRMVIDYRSINKLTKSIPTNIETWEQLSTKINPKSTKFTTLDLTSSYHLIRLDEYTRRFTCFATPFGKFRFLVLPFGMVDSPMVFTDYLSTLFFDHKIEALKYMDDILIESHDSLSNHITKLHKIFAVFQKEKLKLNLEKCHFYQSSVNWVGHEISSNSISPTQTNIDTINQIFSKRPTSKHDIQVLLGHIGYYMKNIPHFGDKTWNLTNLLQKNAVFKWPVECETEYQNLKNIILHQLIPFDTSKPCVIFCDASQYATGSVLLQVDSSDVSKLRPVCFRAHKFNAVEKNWSIGEKEMFSVINAISQFRVYIHGHDTKIYTDHHSVADIFNNPQSAKQERWLDKILTANVEVVYVKGELNVIADHLSRSPQFQATSYHFTTIPTTQVWYSLLRTSYTTDPVFKTKLDGNDPKFTLQDKLLYKASRLCIPQQLVTPFLEQEHSDLLAGHIGIRRLISKLRPYYYFNDFNKSIQHFVQQCHICQRVKHKNSFPPGLLQLPDVPPNRWHTIQLDFITGLPLVTNSFGMKFDAILTIVDKLTRRSIFIPTVTTITSQGLIELLTTHVFANHGIPTILQSDNGRQMASKNFRHFCKSWNIELKLGVPFHQASNGVVERHNALIEDYLKMFVHDNKDWLSLLPFGQLSINSQPHTSLKNLSPFQADISYSPSTPTTLHHETELSSKEMLPKIRAAIQEMGDRYKRSYDSKHRAVEYEVDDNVFIDLRVLPSIPDVEIKQLAHKLRPSFIGPFKIVKKLSALNYELNLPNSIKRHKIFHISHLRLQKSLDSSLPTPENTTRAYRLYKDGSMDMEIKSILNHQKKAKGYSILVQFLDDSENWVRYSDLKRSAPILLEEYINQNNLQIP